MPGRKSYNVTSEIIHPLITFYNKELLNYFSLPINIIPSCMQFNNLLKL